MAATCDYERAAGRHGRRPGRRAAGAAPTDSGPSCSRAGPGRRSSPGSVPTSTAIIRALDPALPAVIVVPIGFVSDHMEVVYDLDRRAAADALERRHPSRPHGHARDRPEVRRHDLRPGRGGRRAATAGRCWAISGRSPALAPRAAGPSRADLAPARRREPARDRREAAARGGGERREGGEAPAERVGRSGGLDPAERLGQPALAPTRHRPRCRSSQPRSRFSSWPSRSVSWLTWARRAASLASKVSVTST